MIIIMAYEVLLRIKTCGIESYSERVTHKNLTRRRIAIVLNIIEIINSNSQTSQAPRLEGIVNHLDVLRGLDA